MEIVVNVQALTWDDYCLLSELSGKGGALSVREIPRVRAMFDRCVEGGVGELPMWDSYPRILDAIGEALRGTQNPKGTTEPSATD